jgi:hypothetical protein
MQQLHQGQLPGPNSLPTVPSIPNNSYNTAHQNGSGFDASQQGAHGFQQSQNQNGFSNGTSKNEFEVPLGISAKTAGGAAPVTSQAPSSTEGTGKSTQPTDSVPDLKPEETRGEKKTKKEKEKETRMIYSDNEMSPEEKLARLPRYAFVPDQKGETVLGDATTAAVTGVVRGEGDNYD